MRSYSIRHRAAALLVALLLTWAALPASASTVGIPGESLLLPEDIAAEAAILVEASTGTVLFEKNADRAMYPASTTKVMTCLLALEHGDLDSVVTIPKEAADVPADSSLVPVTVGERMTLRDLLYGFMICSGNDAGNAIAVIIGGSVSAFVDMMNAKAASLGMTGTHYANPHGYHADDHYTTARDMAVLAREALRNDDFRAIVSTAGYAMPPTNLRENALKVVTTNEMLIPSSSHYYEGCIGVKTGFTRAAGRTFIGAAERDGVTLISVALKSDAAKDGENIWDDTAKMLDHGFSRCTSFLFSQLYAMGPAAVNIDRASALDLYNGALTLRAEAISGDVPIVCVDGDTAGTIEAFRQGLHYEITRALEAPVQTGDIIGTVTYTSPAGKVATATLVASRDIEVAAEEAVAQGGLPLLGEIDWDAARSVLRGAAIALAVLLAFGVVLRANARARRSRRREQVRRSSYARPRGTYRERDTW